MAFYNLVQVTTNTSGTGTIALGAAVVGFKDFSSIPNGTTVAYGIVDGNNREVGNGVYSAGTLTRGPITSSNSNNAISLIGNNAIVYLTPNSTTMVNLDSPAFTGTPTAPTAPAGTNNTQIATTQFVLNNKPSFATARIYA
jgi:hypothetical protein